MFNQRQSPLDVLVVRLAAGKDQPSGARRSSEQLG
jgi:hypothetical protein